MADWRERGYVPDSDDEDEESLGKTSFGDQLSGSRIDQKPAATTDDLTILQDVEEDAAKSDELPASLVVSSPATHFEHSDAKRSHESGRKPSTEQPEKENSASTDDGAQRSRYGISVVAQLEAQLQHGLEVCRGIRLSPPPHPPPSEASSSPLSSPPESLVGSPERASTHQSTPRQALSAASDDIPSSTARWQNAATFRSLRHRTAAQLHPYSIDAVKHQTEWASRGLRPVRVRDLDDRLRYNIAKYRDESQAESAFQSSSMGSPPKRFSADENVEANEEDESQEPLRRLPSSTMQTLNAHDASDGDLDQLMGIRPKTFHAEGRNRRKKIVQNKNLPRQRLLPSVEIPGHPDEADRLTESSFSIFDMPPSPPRSGSLAAAIGPVSATPRRPPTPVISSDKQHGKRRIIEVSSSSEEIGSGGDLEDEDSSSGTSSNERPQNLVHIRRRIRGVLPASWLKLDAHQQKSKASTHASVRSPDKRPAKGVARHVPRRPIPSAGARPELLDFSSGGEESDSSSKQKVQASKLRPTSEPEGEDLVMDDLVEEDTIDRMLPGASRGRNTQKPRKKRQQRLDTSWVTDRTTQHATPYPNTTPAVNNRVGVTGLSKQKPKRLKMKSVPTQLSILDAPGLMGLSYAQQPQFLRVAARSKVPGRRAKPQDATQKFFKLANSQDTADVNEELSNWRTNRQTHRWAKSRQSTAFRLDEQHHPRQPFITSVQRFQDGHTTTTTHDSPNISNTVQLLKNSTAATLARLQQRSEADRGQLKSSVSHPAPIAPRRLQAGFVSWHSNRAGRGNFWSRMLERPTQLETIDPTSLTKKRVPRLAPSSRPRLAMEVQQAPQPRTLTSGSFPSRPKKLAKPVPTSAPVTTGQAMDNMAHTSEFVSIPQPAHRTHNTTIELAVSRAAAVIQPLAESRLELSSFITEGKLTAVIESAVTRKTLPEAIVAAETTLWTLKSKREICCTDDTAEIMAFIQETMDEALDIVSTKPGSNCISEACASVEPIIEFFNQGINSFNDSKRVDLILGMTQHLDAAITYISSQISESSNLSASLSLLNQFMILAFQVFMATRATTGPEWTASANWERARSVALELLVSTKGLQKLSEPSTSWEDIALDPDALLYLQSLMLVLHLTEAAGRHHDLDTLLLEAVKTSCGDSTTACLATAVLLVPTIYPLSFMDDRGVFRKHRTISFDAWSLLGPSLKAFLEDFMGKKQHRKESMAIGLKALEICLSLAADHAWVIPDTLLQLLFKYYGRNDMVELFAEPNILRAVERVSNYPVTDPGFSATDFDIFLRLVAIALEQRSLDLESSNNALSKKNKLIGLVFSLAPNYSRVMNEQEDIHAAVYQTMTNTYALYATLYSFAPRGCGPRVAQIENLLDFSTSHSRVRDLTIASWARMCRTAVVKGADPAEVKALSSLGHQMWRALASKVTTALNSEAVFGSFFVHKHNLDNCQPVMVQLANMLRNWMTAVSLCTVPADAEALVDADFLKEILRMLQFLQNHFEKLQSIHKVAFDALIAEYRKHDLDLSMLRLVRAVCMGVSPTLQAQAMRTAREIVSAILSSRDESTPRLEIVISIWFDIARQDVGTNRDRWDQYLESTSSLSLRLLANTGISQQCEALLLSHIVWKIPTYFELDPESLYSRWLKCILKPTSELRFEHILTSRVMWRNPGNLPLQELGDLMGDSQGRDMTLGVFKDYRTDIVRHIIRSIYGLQFTGPEDSQDLIEELVDEESGRRLLLNIAETMKSSWLRCYHAGGDDSYTQFVQAIVHEIEIYQFPGFKLDVWFTDPQRSEFPVAEDRFQLLFTRRPGSFNRELDVAFVTRFRQDNQKMSNTPRQTDWVQKMIAALSCSTSFEGTNFDSQPTMDGRLQVQFMQNVLSVYIQFTFSKGPRHAVWTIPVIQILIRVIKDIHLRKDLAETGRDEELAAMCMELLMHARQALDALVRWDAPRRRHVMMLAIKLIELASCCISRIHNFYMCNPESEIFEELIGPMVSMASAIHECITDKRFDARVGTDEPGPVPPGETAMTYIPRHVREGPVPGTVAEIRQMTVNDIDEALTRGCQPGGLGENWSFWSEDMCKTYTGWEAYLGQEINLLWTASQEFCRLASAIGVVDGDIGWQQWENLARYGSRSVPADPPVQEQEEQGPLLSFDCHNLADIEEALKYE
ncbi:uncharacterized protein HMPREF1541_02351 [Cyphellophora europaea CBS 101466]|uniref:Uncharacterized protein n=1 Tax=Cyphellophora europaea (strain CBS 101466) TaxID=1220924 RepID=W2S3C5_CYPE1|nr:uncharacterized protein HMPREF1541_02351 [Cyphellophora europaea CBS 101466]ETN43192.1 hypothetical protein HMPREF1541_02351 [Cyphellophora europaea CBS 101466]